MCSPYSMYFSELKPDDLKDYFPKFLRRLHATMLAYGNTTSQVSCTHSLRTKLH